MGFFISQNFLLKTNLLNLLAIQEVSVESEGFEPSSKQVTKGLSTRLV